MAKRHETLTAEADAVAVRLAAARLRDLWDERDRRKEGWDEGSRDAQPRERLDALDGAGRAAADERARSVWALQEAEASFARPRAPSPARARAPPRRSSSSPRPVRRSPPDQPRCSLAALEEDLRRLEAVRRDGGGARGARPRARGGGVRVRLGGGRGATPRTSAGASPRRRPRTVPRWRRSAARSPRTTGAFAAGGVARQVRERKTAGEAEREALAADVERLDASTAPLADRRSELGASGTGSRTRWPSSRRARASSCAATCFGPGSTTSSAPRLPVPRGARRPRRGLLGQLIRAIDGWDRALRAGLGSLADAVVYEDAGARWPTPRPARAPRSRSPVAGPPRSSSRASGRCFRSSTRTRRCGARLDPAEGHLPGRDAGGGGRQARRTPEGVVRHPHGVLVGPALIRTTLTADSRAEEVRGSSPSSSATWRGRFGAEAASRQARRDLGGSAELAEAIDEADAGSRTPPSASHDRRELASVGKREDPRRNGSPGWTTRPPPGADPRGGRARDSRAPPAAADARAPIQPGSPSRRSAASATGSRRVVVRPRRARHPRGAGRRHPPRPGGKATRARTGRSVG